MDVGAPNFRFTLDDPEKPAETYRHPKTAELHLDSLDRYNDNNVPLFASIPTESYTDVKLLGGNFGASTLNSTNNCVLQTKRNLIYGYMSRVALTQFNLSYKVPTVVTGVNDKFNFLINGNTATIFTGTLPQGYYNVLTLGNALEAAIKAAAPALGALTVTDPTTQQGATTGTSIPVGYTINTNSVSQTFEFTVLATSAALGSIVGRCFRLLGVNRAALAFAPDTNYPAPTTPFGNSPSTVFTMGVPNFRQTDYVDIVSQALTNYKDTKDANSSIVSPGSVIGRIWLTEYPLSSQTVNFGWPQDGMWGMSPMTFTKTWTSPNWSQWSPNQAINTVDITLLDQWNQPLFWSSTYNTEWSATVTVTE